jgi:hypothetical protein
LIQNLKIVLKQSTTSLIVICKQKANISHQTQSDEMKTFPRSHYQNGKSFHHQNEKNSIKTLNTLLKVDCVQSHLSLSLFPPQKP